MLIFNNDDYTLIFMLIQLVARGQDCVKTIDPVILSIIKIDDLL